jgi:proline-specific peptidase
MIVSAVLSTLLVVLLLSETESADDADAPTAALWRCDDMTPNLCSNLQSSTGHVTTRNGLKVRYWKYFVDEVKNTQKGLPLLIINGGPGSPHNYNLPLRQLACDGAHSAVIFYDQGGTGESSIPLDASLQVDYPFLLDIDYLAGEELQAVIDATILSDDKNIQFHIIGDSFGTMIALQYVLLYRNKKDRNKHIESLVLNGPIPSSKEFVDHAWDPKTGSIGTMPAFFRQRYQAIADKKDFDSPEFQAMERSMFANYSYRSAILADCFLETFGKINQDIYLHMWGVSDYVPIEGTLGPFDVYPTLQKYRGELPPLRLTYGEFDEIREPAVFKLNDMWKKAGGYSEYQMFEGSGHASIGDATAELIRTTGDFINRVERDELCLDDECNESNGKEVRHRQAPWTFLRGIFIGCLIGIVTGFQVSRCTYRRANQYRELSNAS